MRDTGGGPGVRNTRFGRWALAVAPLAALLAVSGCFKIDRTDDELKAAQTEWGARIASLRARQSEVGWQLKAAQERLTKEQSVWAVAMHRRLEAAVVSNEEGLTELDKEVERLPLEVKSAPDHPAALAEARIRMAGYLRVQDENLISALSEVTLADHGEPKGDTAAVANGDGK